MKIPRVWRDFQARAGKSEESSDFSTARHFHSLNHKAKVENVLDALRAVTNLPAWVAPPCWLEGDPGFDPTEMLPCRNGLLHIPTRQLQPATPALFALNGMDFDFDPQAPKPKNWLRFRRDLWPEDEESRDTRQELSGYFGTLRTHFQKIGLLVGPKRGGKGTIGRVMRRVSGERDACAPTLDALSKLFGLAVLIGKTVVVISDACISGRRDTDHQLVFHRRVGSPVCTICKRLDLSVLLTSEGKKSAQGEVTNSIPVCFPSRRSEPVAKPVSMWLECSSGWAALWS